MDRLLEAHNSLPYTLAKRLKTAYDENIRYLDPGPPNPDPMKMNNL